MKPSTKDQAKGTFEHLKGKIRELAGTICGRHTPAAGGRNQKFAGKDQEQRAEVEKVVGK